MNPENENYVEEPVFEIKNLTSAPKLGETERPEPVRTIELIEIPEVEVDEALDMEEDAQVEPEEYPENTEFLSLVNKLRLEQAESRSVPSAKKVREAGENLVGGILYDLREYVIATGELPVLADLQAVVMLAHDLIRVERSIKPEESGAVQGK